MGATVQRDEEGGLIKHMLEDDIYLNERARNARSIFIWRRLISHPQPNLLPTIFNTNPS
jgi:hypothetical protein